jgi:hypothetical protein
MGNQTQNMGPNPKENFFKAQMLNRASIIPGAKNLMTYSNLTDGMTAAAAYNSRVLATQINGGGPDVSPISAPFSFFDFVSGNRSLTTATTTVAAKKKGRFW